MFNCFPHRQIRRKSASGFVVACLGLLLTVPAALAQDTTKASAPTLTDANIAAIVLAANTADIENGKLAQSKATSADVKQFAETMITDHTAVNEQAAALAGKLKLTPAPSQASRDLTANTDATRKAMEAKSGEAFDQAYIDNEVAYHQSVLDTIDKALIPSARNAELKALIQKVRPAFVAHLEHAREIQASLED